PADVVGANEFESFGLSGSCIDILPHILQRRAHTALSSEVRIEKVFAPRNQEAAHARFLIDDQLKQCICRMHHGIGFFDPATEVYEVIDYQDEENDADLPEA